jgi:hypothetical protein
LNNYSSRRFRHSSYTSLNENMCVMSFIPFGIMVAHCAKKDDKNNKPSRVYGM